MKSEKAKILKLEAEIKSLSDENKALKKGTNTGITMKMSEKETLSMYGMDRFPMTLYKKQ